MESRAFFLSLGAFGVGVCIGTLYTIPLFVSAFFLLIGTLFMCGWFVTRRRICASIAIILMVFAFGQLRAHIAPTTPPHIFSPLFNADNTLTGTIRADPDIREGNQRLTIEMDREGEHMRFIAVAPLYPEFSYGEIVRVSGTLEKPAPFDTDGGRTFKYDYFLAKDGVFGIVNDARVTHAGFAHGVGTAIQRALYGVKHSFEHSLALSLPEPYDGLATGILAGGKQGLGKELEDAFLVAGLLPIIVLSGYNVMIVAESILGALSFLPKRVALTLAGIAIAAFVSAAGGGSSALRAGLMAGLALFARAFGRTYDVLRALGLVATLMLLWNPLLLVYDPGFQFSFMATVGLIIGTPIMERYMLFVRGAFMREIVSTTLAAQIAVLPILLYQTGNLSLVSVPANIFILPFVPLTMLLAFVAGLVALAVPALAAVAGLPAYAFLWYIIRVAEVSAKIPLAMVVVPAFPFAVVVGMYAVLAFLVARLKEKEAPPPKGAAASSAATPP